MMHVLRDCPKVKSVGQAAALCISMKLWLAQRSLESVDAIWDMPCNSSE